MEQANVFLKGFAGAAERSGASKRTRSKSRDLAEKGFVYGGRLYGYDNHPAGGEHAGLKDPPKVRVVNPEQADVVLRVFRVYADGMGHRAIRDMLNSENVRGPRGKWTQTAVRDMLANEAYIGIVTWGRFRSVVRKGRTVNVPQPVSEWIRREIPGMRIVDDDLWAKVQARREARRSATPRGRGGRLMGRTRQEDLRSHHLLSGLMTFGLAAAPYGSKRRSGAARARSTPRAGTCAAPSRPAGSRAARTASASRRM